MSTSSPLPPLYDRWMREALKYPVPNESKATCGDCAMCAAPGHEAAPNDPVFYDPNTKCCSYMPMMWNFLTGAVLASDAFFPFSDGPQVALDAGIAAVIQPGGSVRDAQVVEAVDAAGAAMVFTSRRHFRH